MAHDVYPAPLEEAVGLAIDSYIAALTDDQVDALLTRVRPPRYARNPAKRKGRKTTKYTLEEIECP